MSSVFFDRIEAVLDGLPSDASAHEVYDALSDFEDVDVRTVLATRSLTSGGGSQPVVENPGNSWAALTAVADGYRIAVDLADNPTGDLLGVMEVTTAGTTGADEPTWRTGLGGEFVDDDTAVWQYIGLIGRIPISEVGGTTIYQAEGEVQVGDRGTIQGDGVADVGQRATVYGDGNAVASLSGYAGSGNVDVDSSGTLAGDGAVDASHTAVVNGDGATNGESTAWVKGSGTANTTGLAQVGGATGTATSGFRSRADGILGDPKEIGMIATADPVAGLQLMSFGIPTADPMVAGAIWADGGVLTVSEGP